MTMTRPLARLRASAYRAATTGLALASTLALLPQPASAAPCPIATPVIGEYSSGFGHRGRGFHPGVDIRAPVGSPVRAPVGGTVLYTGRYYAYGLIVDIQHRDGSVSRYAHLSRISPEVRPGGLVAPGEVIGAVGRTGRSTGPHLHVELRRDGRPVDPWPWLTRTACVDDRQLAEAPR